MAATSYYDGRFRHQGNHVESPMLLQAALNGDRVHPAVPRRSDQIGVAALEAIRAGAQSVHVHAFDDYDRETLDGVSCAKVLKAIRSLCPAVSVSLTTSATIVTDPVRRLKLIEAWSEMPDFVTANQGEPGIVDVCKLLLSRGVGIEAGLLTAEDARAFVRSGLADRCHRVLIEPLDEDESTALQHAAVIEDIVLKAGIQLQQIHHGYGMACWKVNQRAFERGHGIRTGLEDVASLPNGQPAKDNAELVRAAVVLMKTTKNVMAVR